MSGVVDLPVPLDGRGASWLEKYMRRLMMSYMGNDEAFWKCLQGLPRAKQLE